MNLPGQQPGSEPDRIRFEGFEADLRAEELLRAGRKLRLAQQSFRVLAMLLEKPGQLVTRQELRARLWPSGTLVEYDGTSKIFGNPLDTRTENYITGRFG